MDFETDFENRPSIFLTASIIQLQDHKCFITVVFCMNDMLDESYKINGLNHIGGTNWAHKSRTKPKLSYQLVFL